MNLSARQSVAWKYLHAPDINEVFYGGAAGGGKSFLGCLWHIKQRTTYPLTRGLIGRAKLTSLKESTLVTLFDVASQMGYVTNKDFRYNAQSNKIYWANGSVTILKDLFQYPSDPDFHSLGSTEFTDAFIDEVPGVTQKAYDIVKSRIRYRLDEHGLTPKIFTTGNPSRNWVKSKFIDPEKLPSDTRVVRALLSDNPDERFIALYRKQLEGMTSEYDRQRLLFGNWDAEDAADNPFLFNFDPARHVTEYAPDYTRRLFISIDFNVDPMCAIFAHIYEVSGQLTIDIHDEMSVTGATIQKVVDYIRSNHGAVLHGAVMTGDGTELKRRIGMESNASLFEQLRVSLRLGSAQMQVPAPPTHQVSRDECNYLLHNATVRIRPNLNGLIADCRTVACDNEGQIIKGNRKYDAQRADLLDVFRYLCHLPICRQWIERHRRTQRH